MGVINDRLKKAKDQRINDKIVLLQRRLHEPIEKNYDPRSPEYRQRMTHANNIIRRYTKSLNS